MATIHKLYYSIIDNEESSIRNTKITLVGCGQVGSAVAFSLMVQGTCTELAMIDVLEDKLKGEMLDLQHGQQFLHNMRIIAGTDYDISADSNIVVITAGVRKREGEVKQGLIQRNVDIFKVIVPQIVEQSPKCIIIVASYPVDILSYVAWRLSGFPRNRVIGLGTMLDSARFRFMLGERLGVSSQSVHAYILGECSTKSVPVWSGVTVGGNRLLDINPDINTDKDYEGFGNIHKSVVSSANELASLKGYAAWASAVCVSSLCNYILKNQTKILPLSTLAKHDGALKGLQGIDKDIFISLPCVVTSAGVSHIVPPHLSEEEKENLFINAKNLDEEIACINW